MPSSDTVTYDRAKLFEEVWAEPVQTVAKRYGISDVALAKTCRRLSLPLPGRGYWAKKRAGKAPDRPPLPPFDGPQSIAVERCSPDEEAGKRVRTDLPKVAVPASLRRPHPLIAETLDDLRHQDFSRGLSFCRVRGKLDITVTKGSVKRALRIMDALIKHLEKNGMPVRVESKPRQGYWNGDRFGVTEAHCAGEWVSFALRERQRRVTGPPPRWATRGGIYDHPTSELEPSGLLELSLTSGRLLGQRKIWCDGKRQRLEDRLGDFVVGLQAAGEHLMVVHAEDLRRRQASEEAERRRKEEADRRRREQERAERLFSWVERRRQAESLRTLAREALDELGERDLEIEPGVSLREELDWALGYADRIDPLKG
jgi:hypothetical protein